MDEFHVPVLLHEVIEGLRVQNGKKYIDATLGGGGHASRILELGGKVLGIDVDQEAIGFVKKKFEIRNSKFEIDKDIVLVRGNFREIGTIARAHGFERVSGILFDLGVSSHQLDTPERGFSFGKSGPLDMRMDKDLAVSALDLINGLGKRELYDLFIKLGEEHRAHAISQAIVRARRVRPITTTKELADVIVQSSKYRKGEIHPATKVFQALRIAVNDELHAIREALPQALELLEENGRLLVISFQSLEDRIVKEQFKQFETDAKGIIITKKPIVVSDEELSKNARCRSSKLRIFEKKIT